MIGFGTLDDELLKSAMKTLESIGGDNRLVGLISHVSELENRIDKKVIVEKEQGIKMAMGPMDCLLLKFLY